MAKINLDIAHDCNLGEFLESVEKHNLKISEFIAIGPGGGNPNITFEGSHVNCHNFLMDEMRLGEFYADDEITEMFFIEVETA